MEFPLDHLWNPPEGPVEQTSRCVWVALIGVALVWTSGHLLALIPALVPSYLKLSSF